MVPICLGCLPAIFKYLYQCIYGDRSGYISGGGRTASAPAGATAEGVKTQAGFPSKQTLSLLSSLAQKVNIHFSQGIREGQATAGLSCALGGAMWESESPAHRCRELLL